MTQLQLTSEKEIKDMQLTCFKTKGYQSIYNYLDYMIKVALTTNINEELKFALAYQAYKIMKEKCFSLV